MRAELGLRDKLNQGMTSPVGCLIRCCNQRSQSFLRPNQSHHIVGLLAWSDAGVLTNMLRELELEGLMGAQSSVFGQSEICGGRCLSSFGYNMYTSWAEFVGAN